MTVPTVLWVDEAHGVLGLEKIEGWSVREVLGGGAEGEAAQEDAAEGEEEIAVDETEEEDETEGMKALKEAGVTVEALMSAIGAALARLHITTIVHGDLTTSNMMVRLTPDRPGEAFEIVSFNDFGLQHGSKNASAHTRSSSISDSQRRRSTLRTTRLTYTFSNALSRPHIHSRRECMLV